MRRSMRVRAANTFCYRRGEAVRRMGLPDCSCRLAVMVCLAHSPSEVAIANTVDFAISSTRRALVVLLKHDEKGDLEMRHAVDPFLGPALFD